MALTFRCPACGRTIRAKEELGGKVANCPGCRKSIAIPFSSVPQPIPDVVPQQPRPLMTSSSRRESFHGSRIEVPMPAQGVVAVQVSQPTVRHNSLGVASLILGILALLICWVPFLNLLGLPLAFLGILLGGIGLLLAILRRGSGIGFSIAGCAISLLAAAVTIGMLMAVREIVESTASAVDIQAPELAQGRGFAVEKGADPAAHIQGGAGEFTKPERIDASQPLIIGDVSVQVIGVTVGPLNLRDSINGSAQSEEQLLAIKLKIQNRSQQKTLTYRTWRGKDFSLERDYATLTDDVGNIYRRISFSLGMLPEDGVERESIYPGQAIVDTLVFEPPVDGIDYLLLELPLVNIGGKGMTTFHIPATMISRE